MAVTASAKITNKRSEDEEDSALDDLTDSFTDDITDDIEDDSTDELYDSDDSLLDPSNSISPRATTTSLNGCVSLNGKIDVTGGLQGTIKGIFDKATTIPIFSKDVQLFKV